MVALRMLKFEALSNRLGGGLIVDFEASNVHMFGFRALSNRSSNGLIISFEILQICRGGVGL